MLSVDNPEGLPIVLRTGEESEILKVALNVSFYLSVLCLLTSTVLQRLSNLLELLRGLA